MPVLSQPDCAHAVGLLLLLQVCWSPFSPSRFLSASADWSVRLWHEAQPRRPLATLALPGARAEVADAAFCPAAATLLAAAAGNSLQVRVWGSGGRAHGC